MSRISMGVRAGLLVLVAAFLPLSVTAAPFAAYVMDARTGQELHAQNANTRLHPASLTKMMTLYLAFTAIERGQIRLDSKIPISQNAANQPPSRLGLKAGQQIELRYLIRAAAVKSANDAATAIAEGLGGGSEEHYTTQMTNMARALGMRNTQFRNAHGLTANGHYSTARDMTILGRRLFYDFPQYYNLFSRRSADAGIATVASTNRRFLDSYDGADGIKTGYTRAAGFNLTASAQRGQKRIIATVMGGTSTAHRNQVMAQLLDAGFSRAPTRAREERPAPPQYMVEQRVRRSTQVARSQPAPAPFTIATSNRPAARASTVPGVTPAAVSNALRDAKADTVRPASAGAIMQASIRPPRKPSGHAPAVIATKSPTDLAVEMAIASQPAQNGANADQGLTQSARPVRKGRGRDELSSLSDTLRAPGATFIQTTAPQPETLTLAAATAPRGETIILAAMNPAAQPEQMPTEVVSRVSSSGGKNWGINIGLYRSQGEAEQILLRTALQESATLNNALRRVANTNRGFEAGFSGLTRSDAELACSKLSARQMPCDIRRP